MSESLEKQALDEFLRALGYSETLGTPPKAVTKVSVEMGYIQVDYATTQGMRRDVYDIRAEQ